MRCTTAGDRGAGTVLAVGLIGATAGLSLLLVPVIGVTLAQRRAAGAADASALAAADVIAGIAPGVPCAVAARVSAANGSSLRGCDVEGEVVTVSAVTRFGGIEVVVAASAGPP